MSRENAPPAPERRTYAITGPGWNGTLPAGMKEYKSPTGIVWLLGRIYCTGTPEDYKAVHALQDKVIGSAAELFWQTVQAPSRAKSIRMGVEKVGARSGAELDGNAYFKLFAELLKTNPPTADDAPMVATLAKIGIVPGQDFDASKLEPAAAKGVAGAPKPAQEKIMGHFKEAAHSRTAGSLRRRPESTAPIICNGR